MSDSLGSLTASLGLDTSSLSSGVASAKSALGSLAGPVGIAVGAAVGLGAAMFAVGEKFKDAYNKIQVGTGATGAALAGLEGSFKTVLAGTAGSFDQVAAAITGISQRTGLTGAALDDFAKKEVTLGRITKTDVGDNVQATTALFNLYGIAAENQSTKLDVLFKASQVAGVSVAELTSQVQAATPVAKALGMTFDQTAALTANLTQAGLPAAKVMQGLGKEFTAAAKAGKDPISVIADIEEQIKKAPNDTAAAEIAFQKFGVRAGPQLSAALRSGKFDLAQTLALIESGKGGINETGAAISTLGGKFARLKNEVMVALEPIGSGLYNLVNKGMGSLLKEIDVLGPKIAAGFAAMKAAFSGGGVTSDGFVGAMERIGVVARDVVEKFKAAWPDIKRIAGEVKDALTPIGEFIEAHLKPILIGLAVAVAAITAPWLTLAAALIYAYERFSGVRTVVDAVAKFLTGTVAPAVAAFASYVSEQFGHLVDYVRSIWPQVSEAIGHVMVVIRDVLGAGLAVLRELWQDWGSHLLDIAKVVWDEVKTVISDAIRLVRDVINVVLAVINGDWGKAWDGLKDIVATAFGFIKDTVGNMLRVLRDLIAGEMATIGSVFSAAWNAIRDVARAALHDVVDFFLHAAIDIIGAAEKAFGWVPGLGGKLREAHDKLVEFKDGTNATLDQITKNVDITVHTSHVDTYVETRDTNTSQPNDAAAPGGDFMGGVIARAMGGLRKAASGLAMLGPGGGRPHGPTLVSEAGWDEFVITPDPLYRVRNIGLLNQANQALGSPLGQGSQTPDLSALGPIITAAIAEAFASTPIRADVVASDLARGLALARRR